MNKTLGAMLVVILVATAGAYLYPKVQKPLSAQSQQVTEGDCFVSPIGVYTCQYRQAFAQATTTVCSFISPSAASSTLAAAWMRLNQGTTTAATLRIAKAGAGVANNNASTTVITYTDLASGAQGTLVASTTGSVPIDSVLVFAPSTRLNFSIQGGTGTFSQGLGSACFATFVH